ncbi:Tn5252, Orf 10 protein [Streptococcus pneumoniae]|nr:Tn5252, Orf 10 protein [Streptococcus pneumoniae]VIT02603.1 Tn5252, Orf 10 protein [Streptococcus pneumoniae]VIU87044.1 Tn5252, Orf 10 protein [Streptococcus pneumoniae]VJD90926.1 Tn5252, Orf 10 protein [Streptococcus pneumoniae]VJG22796.1 Tn5252, Orf 10 protein [Streptococcus pneumoniae]
MKVGSLVGTLRSLNSQKFEQISRDVHLVLIIARENHQVTQEHVSILLTCVQELIAEVNQVQSLSRGFREKYMR